MAIKNAQQFP